MGAVPGVKLHPARCQRDEPGCEEISGCPEWGKRQPYSATIDITTLVPSIVDCSNDKVNYVRFVDFKLHVNISTRTSKEGPTKVWKL